MSLLGLLGKGFGPTTASSPPVAPTISVVDNKDGTGGVVSIVDSSAGSTNNVYYYNGAGWILEGTRFDDGNVVVTPGDGSYWWKVESITAGGLATSNLIYQPLTNSTLGNPFVKVFNALWDLLEADPEFTARVPIGNRVKYNIADDRQPLKQDITTQDLPEVAIVFTTGSTNIPDTSSSSKIIGNYQLIVNTGDYRINEFMNVLNWIVVCNFARWREVLLSLTWKDQAFITRVSPVNITMGESDPQRNRGIKGWTTLWAVEIEMHFKTSNLVFSE